MKPSPPTVLVASADRLFAEACVTYLEAEGGCEVVDVVSDGMHTLASAAKAVPDVVLLVGELPRMGLAPLARRIRQRCPQTRVVILGEAETEHASVLSERAASSDVIAAIHATDEPRTGEAVTASSPVGDVRRLALLTPRERATLRLLAGGLSREEIADRMSIARNTVRTHVQNVYTKLGVHSRVDLIRFAARHGIVSPEEDRTLSDADRE